MTAAEWAFTPGLSYPVPSTHHQTLLSKALFEYSTPLFSHVAAVAMSSKSIQNSSLGANFASNIDISVPSCELFVTVFHPHSCLSVQFVPELTIDVTSVPYESYKSNIFIFSSALYETKYFHRSLRSFRVLSCNRTFLPCFFLNYRKERDINDETHESSDDEEFDNHDGMVGNPEGKSFVALEKICLAAFPPTLRDLQILTNKKLLPNVNHVEIQTYSGSHIEDDSVSRLLKIPCIKELSLNGHYEISDDGMRHFADEQNAAVVGKIETLDITNIFHVTDLGISYLSNMSSLTSLDMYFDDKITDVGICHLRSVVAPNLVQLNLHNCYGVTDAGVRNLFGEIAGDDDEKNDRMFLNLTNLNLSSCMAVGNASADVLSRKCPNLRVLWLGTTCLSNAGMSAIARLNHLEELNLFRCRAISDDGIQHLCATSSKLRILDLQECSFVTDVGVKYLEVFAQNLEELNLCSTGVSIGSAPVLLRMKKLTVLTITFGQRINDDMRRYLRDHFDHACEVL